jgi:hypothetical protein
VLGHRRRCEVHLPLDSGIVNQHVEVGKTRRSPTEKASPFRFYGNVALSDVKGGQFAFCGLQLTLTSAAHNYHTSCVDKLFSQGKPYTSRASSDQNRISTNIQTQFNSRRLRFSFR